MNTYRKIGDTWSILCDAERATGDVVTVTLRDGRTKQETLAERVGTWQGFPIFATAPKVAATVGNVGTMTSMLALFAKAKQNLKYPAIVLSVPAAGMSVRLSIAGPRANVPGSVTVVTSDKDDAGKRDWIGRIRTDGTFECSPRVNGKAEAITARLQAFANDPAGVAAEHGRLTGCCCFCNAMLTDGRSTAVGYGPICATNYGLPWGK